MASQLVSQLFILMAYLWIWKFMTSFSGKGPSPKLEKMIDLTSKLGEIKSIEHNKGRNISS